MSHRHSRSSAACRVHLLLTHVRSLVPDVLRNIKTWYTYYKAPQINKYGYGGQPVNKAVRSCPSQKPPAQLMRGRAARRRHPVGMHMVAGWGNQRLSQSSMLQQHLNTQAVCLMQKAISVVKKTNSYWRALETGARTNTEDKVLARK